MSIPINKIIFYEFNQALAIMSKFILDVLDHFKPYSSFISTQLKKQ